MTQPCDALLQCPNLVTQIVALPIFDFDQVIGIEELWRVIIVGLFETPHSLL